jgi:two-component system, cell cycle response regulator DivK
MAGTKKRVLVVDDEPDVREYLSALLEDNGFEVVTAENGERAHEQVALGIPDVITLDITMPEKSGVRFYRDLRESETLKQIPVIMVTGISSDFEKFISSRRQVPPPEGYMPKPIDRERILAMIHSLTG